LGALIVRDGLGDRIARTTHPSGADINWIAARKPLDEDI
jgi:hypothetical protein